VVKAINIRVTDIGCAYWLMFIFNVSGFDLTKQCLIISKLNMDSHV